MNNSKRNRDRHIQNILACNKLADSMIRKAQGLPQIKTELEEIADSACKHIDVIADAVEEINNINRTE